MGKHYNSDHLKIPRIRYKQVFVLPSVSGSLKTKIMLKFALWVGIGSHVTTKTRKFTL
nr:MAG TPA: hypothetical protein [Inoviridae sp.]